MAHVYDITVPYCAGVCVTVTTDDPIENPADAFDVALSYIDKLKCELKFVGPNGEKIRDAEIHEGSFYIKLGNVINTYQTQIEWEKVNENEY